MLHKDIIIKMRALKYNTQSRGVCFGLSSAFTLSFLTRKGLYEFNEFINTIEALPLTDTEKSLEKYANTTVRLIYTFFDIIEFMQAPKHYPEITQSYGCITSQNFPHFSSIFSPASFSEKKEKIERLICFSGAYTQEELTAYFHSLQQAISSLRKTQHRFFVLNLGAYSHILSIGFLPNTQEWIFMDSNQLPIKNIPLDDINSLINYVMQGLTFNKSENVIFYTEFFGLKSEKINLYTLINCWKKSPDYKKAQIPTAKTVALQDAYLLTWFDFLIRFYKKSRKNGKLKFLEKLELLYQTYPEVINLKNNKGESPIFTALERRLFFVIDYLQAKSNLKLSQLERENLKLAIEFQKNPSLINIFNENGYNHLAQAIMDKNNWLVQYLLQHNHIDPNVKSPLSSNFSPLKFAILHDNTEAFDQLLTHPLIDVNEFTEELTPLRLAIFLQKIDYIKALTSHPNININWIDKNGLSLFNHALISENKKIITHFLQLPNIDITAKNGNGMTPSEFIQSINKNHLNDYLHSSRNILSSEHNEGCFDIDPTAHEQAYEPPTKRRRLS